MKTNTFRETWEALYNSPSLKDLPKNEPVLIYCTGKFENVYIYIYIYIHIYIYRYIDIDIYRYRYR